MFERFTEQARQVLVLADEESRGFKHNYTGTEHILLGLLREERGLGARVLEGLDATVDGVRRQVVQIVGSGEEVTFGQIPYTPRARRVLERTLHEAFSLDHNYISTEHILLALTRETQGVAARILLGFGADSERIRADVFRALSGPRARPQGAGADAHLPPGSTSEELDALLDGAGALLGILVGRGAPGATGRRGRPARGVGLHPRGASCPHTGLGGGSMPPRWRGPAMRLAAAESARAYALRLSSSPSSRRLTPRWRRRSRRQPI